MMTPRKMAAGNWKMNGTQSALTEVSSLASQHPDANCEILICPPATLLYQMAETAKAGVISVGGQDCHAEDSGAHTGDISARMLKDAGAEYVILGHSERRTDHGETDAMVQAKARTAISDGLNVIVCVGETLTEREAEITLDIIGRQLKGSIPENANGENMVVAYEPVWAIGTGKIPTLEQIGEVHNFIRGQLESQLGVAAGTMTRILYGGSVKSSNAVEIFAVPNVDGALVGGASLKSTDFSPIIRALDGST